MVFHDRSLDLMGPDVGEITEVEVGDTLFVAWLDYGNFRMTPFEVTEIIYDMGPDFKVCNGDRVGYLNGPFPVFMFVEVDDAEQRFDPGHPEHYVLGVSTSTDGLALEMILTLTLMGYSPTEAMDYTVPKFGVSPEVWSFLRGEDLDDLEACVERVQEQLEQLSGAG